MKITKYGSATILIETKDTSILCDPWVTDGIYYGAWCNYPPIDMNMCNFENVNYVYISHIHPDHFDPMTMKKLNKKTPVIIHKYHQKFLKFAIERLGFTVLEIDNGVPFKLSNTTEISIYAADNCDPKVCGRMFGCVTSEIKGSMQIDSLCVINDGKNILINTNDCPYVIAKNTLKQIKSIYKNIDFALVGYTSASLYPHCMIDYSKEQLALGKEKAKASGLLTALNTLSVLKPKFYMPFAGTYILGGLNFLKNKHLPLPEIQDAVDFLQEKLKQKQVYTKPILLNFAKTFDLNKNDIIPKYEPVDVKKRKVYIKNIASKFKHDYENDDYPSENELLELFNKSLERLKRKLNDLNFSEDLNLIFDINRKKFVSINLKNTKINLLTNLHKTDNYHRFQLDPRLLKRALMGPKYANWNNIEIGGLLNFARKPDVYRMDVHILINALHV